LHWTMIRTIHRECQVRTPVMIVCKVPRKRTPEVALVEHDAVLTNR
jgi:Transposase